MRSYLQRFLLMLLALSLGLNIAAILLALKIFSWDAQLHSLETAQKHGMRLRWMHPDGSTSDELPTVYDVARGARPWDIHLEKTDFENQLASLKEAALIFKGYGTLKEISIEDAPAVVVETLLANVGEQPRLTGFYSIGAQFPDHATQHLANFPLLKNLAIVGAPISGERFPVLPALENCDLGYSEITPAGLQRVLASPSLTELMVREPEYGSVPLRDAYFTEQKKHPRIRFRGIE